MDPMRLITYTVLAAVVSLVAMGGVGFYIGYSAGRADVEEVKTLIAAGAASPEHGGHAHRASEEGQRQSDRAGCRRPRRSTSTPVLNEIRRSAPRSAGFEQTPDRPGGLETGAATTAGS